MKSTDKQGQRVGIFWLVEGRLIIDSTPLSEAEPYGDCLTHCNGHIDYWTEQQLLGELPLGVEYEEHPRGRVVFNSKTQRFSLYADRCILRRKSVVKQIMKAMCLPESLTEVCTDGREGHYRCSECLRAAERCEADP